MKKLNFIVFISVMTVLNCGKQESNLKFENFDSKGKTIFSKYTFCSISPVEIEYSYRVGKWTFLSSNGYKVAEGEYDTQIEIVNDHGGCTYQYTKSIINLDKWKFWDVNGELIEPSKKILNIIRPHQLKPENLLNKNI